MASSKVYRTPDAIAGLDGIWDYIAADNLIAADRLTDELNDLFDLLAANPEIGELQFHLADCHYRRFTYRRYIIYYRPIDDGIVVVRVLHGARDHERLL